MSKGITFTDEILKKVAKDLNVDKEKVEYVYNSMILYLEYLTKSTSAVSIFITNLGTLHLKNAHIYKNIKKEYFKNKKQKLDSYLKEYFKSKTFKKPYHLEKSKINNFWYNAGKSIREIEEIQNNR